MLPPHLHARRCCLHLPTRVSLPLSFIPSSKSSSASLLALSLAPFRRTLTLSTWWWQTAWGRGMTDNDPSFTSFTSCPPPSSPSRWWRRWRSWCPLRWNRRRGWHACFHRVQHLVGNRNRHRNATLEKPSEPPWQCLTDRRSTHGHVDRSVTACLCLPV